MPKKEAVFIPKEQRKPYQKYDGRFTKRVTLPNGKTKDIIAPTEKEFKAKLKEIEKQIDAGLNIDDKTTVDEWAKHWMEVYKVNLKVNTRDMYSNAYNIHISPYIGLIKLKDVKPIHVQDVINKIADKSYSLQKKVYITILQIFQTAIDNKLLVSTPCVGIQLFKKQTEDVIKILTDSQRQSILEVSKGTRAELFVAIGLYCGLRREETLGLMWNDIDFENNMLKVQRTVIFHNNRPIESNMMKSKSGRRDIPIPQTLIDLLNNSKHKGLYIVPDAKGNLQSEASFRRMWEVVTKKIDFECTSHMLRHTYCTQLHKEGIDLRMAQYLMGHADIKMTSKIYTHIEQSQLKDASSKVQNLYQKKSNQTIPQTFRIYRIKKKA